MKTGFPTLALSLLFAGAHAATVNFVQTSVNDVDASTIGAVASNVYLESAITYSTVVAPASSSGYNFTHWTNSSYPATNYRDAWGRSLNPTSFVLLEDTTCTAHYLPSTRDTDADGVPDWYEIEYYGNLNQNAASDGDSDGITLLVEYSGGSHPLYANAAQEGGVAYADSGMVTCNLGGYVSYTLSSSPTGTVNQFAYAPPGTVVTTPDLSANAAFGYWEVDGVRQQDAWGRAYPQVTFTMAAVNRVAVAYLFAGDTDEDGIPDAYEQFHYGSLANGATSDTDGDGITLLVEYNGSTNPLYLNTSSEGGVTWADSELVTVNLADYSRYTLTSNPSGTVNQTAVVRDGTVVTTPNLTQAAFGYWELDGVRQEDAWGVALRQLSFTMNGADRTAVAYLFSDDSDGDGINDGYEQYHYGSLTNNANSDTDGDGINLLTEYNGGTNPKYLNTSAEGGVSWADSPLVVVNLQPYERLDKMQIGGVLTNFFSSSPSVVSGIQAGTWSSVGVSDWNGDGAPDLFVAHEDGLRVFRNVGTAHNPNFSEITTGFTSLSAYIAGIARPKICGGDWNGDGFGDLVIGGNTGTLRFIASGGTFSSNGSGSDLTLSTTRTSPALGDMNGDGRADLLVLLDDGTVSLFLNDGSAMPFSGSGSPNHLGVTAPDATSIAIGDINQDGIPDVLLADTDGRIWEFIKNGSGGFSLQSKVWGGSYQGFAGGLTLAAVDLEGDGDLDLIGGLANGGIIALRDPSVGRPTGLIARPGAGSVQLDWDPNWQSRIRGYFIYRSTAEAGPFAKRETEYVPLPSYLDSPVSTSSPHFYYVTGVSQFFLQGNSTPRTIESLPSDLAVTQSGKVILAVRPVRGNPGNRVNIRLSIENAMGVAGAGMELRIAYDPAKLTPMGQNQPSGDTVEATGLSRNLIYTDNGATSTGELVINGTGGSLEPGSGKFLTLQFIVGAAVPKPSNLGVTINSAIMFDTFGSPLIVEILALDQPETGVAYIDGDLTGDGLVTTADKDLIKELTKPKSRPATADELSAGDLNGDGKLDHKDMVLLIQMLNNP